MDLVIKNITSESDFKFLNEIIKRLGFKTARLSSQDKEDIALAKAIDEGLKSGFVEKEEVMKTLRKVQSRK